MSNIDKATASLVKAGKILVKGEFRAVVHTGHEYDEHGNIVKFGEVLRETPFGRNVITTNGFDKMLGGNGGEFSMVAGTGSTAPTETDTTLTTYVGKCSARVSATRSFNNNTAALPLWWACEYRTTFNPGALGAGSKNIAEAGVVIGTSLASINGSTAISAHGLIVDGGGSPTPITVDATNEYLDLIWKVTYFLPYDATGTVSLTIEGVPTNFTYYVRPINLTTTGGSYDTRGWQQPSAANFPGWGPTGPTGGYVQPHEASGIRISALSTPDTCNNAGGFYNASSYTSSTYTNGDKYRDFTMAFSPSAGNVGGDVNYAQCSLGLMQFQCSFSAGLSKTNLKQMSLTFRLSLANAP